MYFSPQKSSCSQLSVLVLALFTFKKLNFVISSVKWPIKFTEAGRVFPQLSSCTFSIFRPPHPLAAPLKTPTKKLHKKEARIFRGKIGASTLYLFICSRSPRPSRKLINPHQLIVFSPIDFIKIDSSWHWPLLACASHRTSGTVALRLLGLGNREI